MKKKDNSRTCNTSSHAFSLLHAFTMIRRGILPSTPEERFLDDEQHRNTPVYAFDMKALIFRAVRDNQPRVVEYLLGMSTIPLDTLDVNGHTLLFAAAQVDAIDVVRLLLSLGASANDATSRNQETALFAAARAGAPLSVSLLSRQCHVDFRNIYGNTALHVAAKAGHTTIIELLLQADAKIDPKNRDGRTPLWLAIHHQHIDSVCCLLKRGADARLCDNMGVSAVDEAVSHVRRVIEACVKEDFAPFLVKK